MKIGIIIGSLGFGGAERVALTLAEYWINHHHTVIIFTTMKRPEKEYAIITGINRIECYHGNKIKTTYCLRKELKDKKPDIVLVMDTPMCVVAVPALLGLRIPFIISERSAPTTTAIKRLTKLLSHFLMRFSDGFVFQTNGAKNYYNESIQKKSIVIPNPIKTDMLPKPYRGKKENRIVAVGRLIPAKNYPMLFEAFQIFHERYPDYILQIYGDGPQKEYLKDHILRIGLIDTISLMGSSDQVLEKIATARMFVLSSSIEGMPNALIEAMALGLPCVSTDCPSGGPKDLIDDGVNGLLAEVNNPTNLAKSMIRIVEDPELENKLSNNALRIKEILDISVVGKEWEDYLESVITHHRR